MKQTLAYPKIMITDPKRCPKCGNRLRKYRLRRAGQTCQLWICGCGYQRIKRG